LGSAHERQVVSFGLHLGVAHVHIGKCYASAEGKRAASHPSEPLQQSREPTSTLLASGKDVR
jgi:hypothetical protein